MGSSDCEAIGAGLLAQPVNALTSLAFVAAAIWVVSRRRSGSSVAMAAVLAAVGVGSFVFHGPQPSWGQAVHDVSVVAAGGGAAVVAGIRALRPAAAVLAGGMGLRYLGLTTGPWCDPASWLQPHGGWHILAAIGLALVARAAVPLRSAAT